MARILIASPFIAAVPAVLWLPLAYLYQALESGSAHPLDFVLRNSPGPLDAVLDWGLLVHLALLLLAGVPAEAAFRRRGFQAPWRHALTGLLGCVFTTIEQFVTALVVTGVVIVRSAPPVLEIT